MVHYNKVTWLNHPKWDAPVLVTSTDLIKEHIQLIQGIDVAPCAYFMHEDAIPDSLLTHNRVCLSKDSFKEEMVKCFPLVQMIDLLSYLTGTPWNMHTCKAAEDNTYFFLELKHILHDHQHANRKLVFAKFMAFAISFATLNEKSALCLPE